MAEILMVGVIAWIAGYVVGWKTREYVAITRLSEELSAVEDTPHVVVNIVRDNEVLYAYDHDTFNFLGQGPNLKTLHKRLKERFPNTKFAVRQDNLDELGLDRNDL